MYRVYTKHLISHKNGMPALVATATTTATTAAVCASYHDGCNAAVTMATDARHQRWRWGQRPNAQDRTYWSTPLASTPTDQPPPLRRPIRPPGPPSVVLASYGAAWRAEKLLYLYGSLTESRSIMLGAAAAVRCRQIAIWINFIYHFLCPSVSIESSRVENCH